MNPYFHVRKEDVHQGSALDRNPPFASFDVVLRRDYDGLKAVIDGAATELCAFAEEIQGAHPEIADRIWTLTNERLELPVRVEVVVG